MELKPAKYTYGKTLHNVLIPTQEDFDAIELFNSQLNSNKIPSKTFKHQCKLPVRYFRKHTGMTMSKKSKILIIKNDLPNLDKFTLKGNIYNRDYSGTIEGYFIQYTNDYHKIFEFLQTIKSIDYSTTSIFTPKGFMEAYCTTETTQQELETFEEIPYTNSKLKRDLMDALDPRILSKVKSWLTGDARKYNSL